MNIRYFSHGACSEVTGSKHFLDVGNGILQLEAGMFQGRRQQAYQKNARLKFDPGDVSAIILSHAHFDHSGALPIMVNNGFSGPVYTTPASRDIAEIILLDSAHIQRKDHEYLRKKRSRHPERGLELYPPLYDTDDVIRTMERFSPVNYHTPFIPLPGVTSELFDAGHILGSAVVSLTLNDSIRLAFSGDLGRKNHPIIRDPETVPDPDYLILEGTYGDRLHDPLPRARERLAAIIQQTHDRGGKVIIPAFTIERTQELIYHIHLLLVRGEIPDLPVFVDSPMAVNATTIFKDHPECFDEETYRHFLDKSLDPFGFDTIHYLRTTRESKRLNTMEGPAVIISASGMAENGRILHHLRNHIENPANAVLIVGFMAENTLGRKLVERHDEVKIFGKMHRVRAEIHVLNTFSSHADYNEILRWVGRFDLQRLRKVFLVHGEAQALTELRSRLLDFGVRDVEISRSGEIYRL